MDLTVILAAVWANRLPASASVEPAPTSTAALPIAAPPTATGNAVIASVAPVLEDFYCPQCRRSRQGTILPNPAVAQQGSLTFGHLTMRLLIRCHTCGQVCVQAHGEGASVA